MLVADYVAGNLSYWVISCVTLYLWDLVDMYVGLRHFKFITSPSFGMYYWIRAFFCIALMEIGTTVGILGFDTKYVIAFIVPLSFSAVLQNLVVRVGDVDKSVNVAEVFEKFKFRIEESIINKQEVKKVMWQNKLVQSSVDTRAIMNTCRLYTKKYQEFEDFLKRVKNLTPESVRVEFVSWLVAKAGTVDIVKGLLEDQHPTEKNPPPT